MGELGSLCSGAGPQDSEKMGLKEAQFVPCVVFHSDKIHTDSETYFTA